MTLACTVLLAGCGDDREPVTVGLITKQEANPYWVAVREVAQDVADDEGVTLITATGTSDNDVASQEAAIDDMIAQGVDGILIAPTDSAALLPAVERARAAGVTVIAIDTPFDPEDAPNATFATDNEAAGELVGRYAAARISQLGVQPTVALLGLSPGFLSGDQRQAGFLTGMGLSQDDPAVVAVVDTQGDREQGEAAMTQVLADEPGVNVVYTVNEPAALGALAALRAADVDLGAVVLVSVDGGCEAMKNAVRPGDIDATAMQYPENMAREGILAITGQVRSGESVSGYRQTGTELVTGTPVPDVPSRDIAFGVRTCWGD